MRRLLLIIGLVVAGTITLSLWQPGAAGVPLPTPTPLPQGFTLIPTFVPAYPCQLQQANVHVSDESFCRTETVTERVLAEGDGVIFIQHDYHLGQGCWSGISYDLHELRVCQQDSGFVTTLTDELIDGVLLSPDGEWLVYGTMSIRTPTNPIKPHVYRVRTDGTDIERLDTQGFPEFAVGAPGNLRWLDDSWLALTLWDGTEGGYHAYRLRADGSGEYEALPQPTPTPSR